MLYLAYKRSKSRNTEVCIRGVITAPSSICCWQQWRVVRLESKRNITCGNKKEKRRVCIKR
jgi:hypothetical protein